jgi:sugar phosphate isomerase/epimerase
MRLGGPVFSSLADPQEWVTSLKSNAYRAAYCPLDASASQADIQAYADAARQADIVIAEVGAWSNPLSPDRQVSQDALEHCQRQLALADEIGALCCVNIAGSCGQRWDGPHPDNLTRKTFDRIVETARKIIDAVHPVRAFFTLETMPWMYPDSVDSYLDLLHAIDRKQFAVHLDPVNLICSPQRYFANGALLRECFQKLGPYIKSCHAKDILLSEDLTTHLAEVLPGSGYLDYRVYLTELNHLSPDTPLMCEHLANEVEYQQAAAYIRSAAAEIGIAL